MPLTLLSTVYLLVKLDFIEYGAALCSAKWITESGFSSMSKFNNFCYCLEISMFRNLIGLPPISSQADSLSVIEEIGCSTVMPLGSPIGSGQGLLNLSNIGLIIENAKVPVIIDAGIGVPSEASQAMELGADGVLINSAIAQAENPPEMAKAINYGVKAGRQAFLAGRIKQQDFAVASSPEKNISI